MFIFSYFSFSFFYCSNTPWVKTFDAIWHKRLKMDLKIGSINVRGLGDQVKRREIFNWLPAKKYSVYFIQELHCTENNKNDCRAERGYQVLFSWCASKKVGVVVLFNNNFTFQISKTYSDPEGRFIICDLTGNGKQLTLTNIYAPKNDDSNFFTSAFSHLADFKCDEITIGGDFKKNL